MAKNTIYFDSYAHIGRRAGKDILAPWGTETLVSELERCSIHGALITAHVGSEVHPDVGNPLVDEACREHKRLYACWVGLPDHTGEFPKPSQLIEQMRAKEVRALKLYPRAFNFSVDALTLDPLLDALQFEGIPLLIECGQAGSLREQISWAEVQWICKSYPRLNLLLQAVRFDATRRLLPLLRAFPNLHIECSNYQANGLLEQLCADIGPEQLLFGTEALEKSIGAARAFIDYSDLTETQRTALAGGNLARLLKVDMPKPYAKPPQVDAVLDRAMDGLPIEDSIVIDSHAHFLKKGSKGAGAVYMGNSDVKGLVERNRRLGVKISCGSSWTAIVTDYELGNCDAAEGLVDFPEEFVAYAALDPNYVTDWERELRYWYEEKGCRGIKPYFPRMGIPYNDPRFDPWWEYGNRHHLFAKMHMSDNFTEEMHDLAVRFPNVNFLLAHSGWTWPVCREHIEIARAHPNCFLEITFTSVTHGTIEYMVEQLGAERVVYGSDAPMRDPIPQFGWVVYADISEQDKRNILGLNMQKILNAVQF